jgi:hypothetical protein
MAVLSIFFKRHESQGITKPQVATSNFVLFVFSRSLFMNSTYAKVPSRLVSLFILSRVIVFLLAHVSLYLVGEFDDSATLLLYTSSQPSVLTRLLSPLVRWDAIYFTAIAQRGYKYEHEMAFFPLVPFITGYAGRLGKMAHLLCPLAAISETHREQNKELH